MNRLSKHSSSSCSSGSPIAKFTNEAAKLGAIMLKEFVKKFEEFYVEFRLGRKKARKLFSFLRSHH